MKTMMSVDGKSIIRVSDERASKLFEEGFRYVSKSMWKEKVRDVNKWSAGCQVIASNDDWMEFLGICQEAREHWGN